MNKQTHTVVIYGPGCARCEELELRTRQATNALSGQYDIRHVRDAAAIAAAGVLATPALELDGTLLFSGKVPSLRELQTMLAAEKSSVADAGEGSCCGCSCGTSRREESTACCCGCGSGGGKPFTAKLLLWIVVVVLAMGIVKYINHQERAAEQSAPPAEQPTAP